MSHDQPPCRFLPARKIGYLCGPKTLLGGAALLTSATPGRDHRRWIGEEFHKAWKTGCRAEERRLTPADRLVALGRAVALGPGRLLTLREAARHDSPAPAYAPAAALTVLAAKLHRPAECFETNRAFLRG